MHSKYKAWLLKSAGSIWFLLLSQIVDDRPLGGLYPLLSLWKNVFSNFTVRIGS